MKQDICKTCKWDVCRTMNSIDAHGSEISDQSGHLLLSPVTCPRNSESEILIMEAVDRRSESPSIKSKPNDDTDTLIEQVKSKRKSNRSSKSKNKTNGMKFEENGDPHSETDQLNNFHKDESGENGENVENGENGENRANGENIDPTKTNGMNIESEEIKPEEVRVEVINIKEVHENEVLDAEAKEADFIETPDDKDAEVKSQDSNIFIEVEHVEVTEVLNDSVCSMKTSDIPSEDIKIIVEEDSEEDLEVEIEVGVEMEDVEKDISYHEDLGVDKKEHHENSDAGASYEEVPLEVREENIDKENEVLKADTTVEKDYDDDDKDDNAEDLNESSPNSSFSAKISNFLGKFSPLKNSAHSTEAENSSEKETSIWLDSNDHNSKDTSTSEHIRPYYSRIVGRPGLKSITPQRDLPSSSQGSTMAQLKTPIVNRVFDDSFRVKSEPSRKSNANQNPTLRRVQGKRCLNDDDLEENEGFFSKLSFRKRRKVDDNQGFFGSVLRSPFRKRTVADVQQETSGNLSKFSWLLPHFWFNKRNVSEEKNDTEELDESNNSAENIEEKKTEEATNSAESQEQNSNCRLM